MERKKIIVIGGGPAGLMAAGQAAESGAETLLLEKMKRPGLKLSITGKGRCNLTNIAEIPDFIEHFGRTGKFLRQAFAQFFSHDLIQFLSTHELEIVEERGGRVFPASGKATDVLTLFLKWIQECGVQVKTSTEVKSLIIENGQITGVNTKDRKFHGDAVILAVGGASYPGTGSTGDGYSLAESAGHSIVPLSPALVPLEVSGNFTKNMSGLNLRNINVSLIINGKKKGEEFGEMSFTEFGVSGPVILTLSGKVVSALKDGQQVTLSIDLKPALDYKKLDARLLRDFASRNTEEIRTLLGGTLPREMIPACIRMTGIPPERTGAHITSKERKLLLNWLKDFRLEVNGHRPLAEAIVTAGGVNTREVNPRTMESMKTRGLYIAGELLDLQADTGGYNLQAAFSTGWLAGHSAVEGA